MRNLFCMYVVCYESFHSITRILVMYALHVKWLQLHTIHDLKIESMSMHLYGMVPSYQFNSTPEWRGCDDTSAHKNLSIVIFLLNGETYISFR